MRPVGYFSACVVAVCYCFFLCDGAGSFSLELAGNGTGADSQLQQRAQLWESRIFPEAYLGPAPASVALIGQLLVLCAKTDVSLVERPPLGGFRFLRYPSSLRASLVQLANEAWDAFHDAFHTMTFLQLEMQQVPAHLRTVVRVLKGAPLSILPRMVNISLNSIRSIGEEAAARARSTAHKFGRVMNLTGEITEAVQSRRGEYEWHLWETRLERAQNDALKAASDREIQELEQKQREIDQQVRQADEAHAEAIRQLPTGFKAFKQRLAHAVVDMLPSLLTGYVLGAPAAVGSSVTSTSATGSSQSIPAIDHKEASKVMDVTNSIGNYLNQSNSSSTETAQSFFRNTRVVLEALSRAVTSPNGQRIRKLIDQVLDVVDRISDNDGEKEWNGAKNATAELNQEAQNLYSEALAQRDEVLNTDTNIQMVANLEGPFANERIKIFMTAEYAKEKAKVQMKILQLRLNSYRSYYQIIGRLAMLDMQTVRFEEIIQLLKDATQVLGQLRYQWSALIDFFAVMTYRVDRAVKHSFMPLADAVAIASLADTGRDGREFIATLIVDECQEILGQAYFLRVMAGMYLDVHGKHVNQQLAGLSALTGLSPDQRTAALHALQQQALAAETDIKSRLVVQVTEQLLLITSLVGKAQADLRQIAVQTVN
ncbi:uncharacterized protein LOC129597831 [Paramacrobiotus metropolitanus]|uniref:uncharacterized protein LOC129597831 n=1 Tax=Paramacrobiotus metropolitanus TaxID=2943436 RepID=UPI002446484F|nr:uncharacterized protein LOC129597831 [Paramacrobiotus metropolitanus]XP_055351495.1 uncharacterized protein LOC129597831 [Paramacrobiotus metropolitanus]